MSDPFYTKFSASPELAAVIGKGSYTRPEALRRIWTYIKRHDLQSHHNRRIVNCDVRLAGVFGEGCVSMFALSVRLKKHLLYEHTSDIMFEVTKEKYRY